MPKRRRGERREFNYTYTLPLRWNQEINGSVVVIPLPHDKCDLPCHVIVPKCTAERSAFGKRHNDLGDNSDCKGDALSLCAWCMLLLRKERKIERIGDWGRKRERKKLFIDTAGNCPPGQLWQKWMIFIKSLGFVSSISYISPNRGRPSLYQSQNGRATLLLFWEWRVD